MGRNTSISLGEHFELFVESRIAEGRFKNASEVIRAGLRLLEDEEKGMQVLRNAIDEGISSGHNKDFDPQKHLQSLKLKHKNG
ncbi:MAG TPA: type II toxin-antitoxin system ParD family antitoxin [Chitinophagaceae bacterium]|nr:type II toxin-antitoxin system ParD family antitoxin [Chitinophagaceae bacterium]